MSYYNFNTNNDPIFTYVNGIEGVRSFQLPLGKSAILMDSENPMFFLKTVNAIGQATIKAYKFEEVEIKDPPKSNFATQEDIESINDRLTKLINELKGESKDGKSTIHSNGAE